MGGKLSPKKSDKRFKVNTVSIGILFFVFAIIVLVTPGVGQPQKVLAYVYLGLSVVLAIWALLPSKVHPPPNRWVYFITYALATPAWFFVFLMRWLNGISNTKNVEQFLVSIAGLIWLFCLMMILTRALTELTKEYTNPVRWISLLIPAFWLVQTIIVFLQGNPIGDKMMMAGLFIGTALIVLRQWNPPGEMPF